MVRCFLKIYLLKCLPTSKYYVVEILKDFVSERKKVSLFVHSCLPYVFNDVVGTYMHTKLLKKDKNMRNL